MMAVIQMSDRELTRLRVLIDVVDGRPYTNGPVR